ncbi:MAG TPA: hypothetical protein VG367_12880 [Mucilaginibacter sp.]|jgi:hypothetical protein|nr:hypothetical protein [Mucilaginibacter sp.]
MKTHKIYFTILLVSIATASCSIINYTKNWQGSDPPGHIYASFDRFNGKQDFNARSFSNGHMEVKYTTELTEGELRLEIKCNSKIVLNRDVSCAIHGSLIIDNPGNKPVQFIFKARQAVGKFDLTY